MPRPEDSRARSEPKKGVEPDRPDDDFSEEDHSLNGASLQRILIRLGILAGVLALGFFGLTYAQKLFKGPETTASGETDGQPDKPPDDPGTGTPALPTAGEGGNLADRLFGGGGTSPALASDDGGFPTSRPAASSRVMPVSSEQVEETANAGDAGGQADPFAGQGGGFAQAGDGFSTQNDTATAQAGDGFGSQEDAGTAQAGDSMGDTKGGFGAAGSGFAGQPAGDQGQGYDPFSGQSGAQDQRGFDKTAQAGVGEPEASGADPFPPASQTDPRAGGSQDWPANGGLPDEADRDEPARLDTFQPQPMPAPSGQGRRVSLASDRSQSAMDDPFADASAAASSADGYAGTEAGEGMGRPGDASLEGPQTPSLVLRKIAPPEIQVGKPALFQIVVRNQGTVSAHEVEIHDEVPQGTRLISTNPKAAGVEQGQILWQLGTLDPGQEMTLDVQLLPVAEGEIGSVASVRFRSDASTRTLATRPQLDVRVAGQPQVMIGELARLTIHVTNTGTGVATGVYLEDAVPAGFQHEAGSELEYEIGDLAPNETKTIELSLLAVKPGRYTNQLAVRGEGNLATEDRSEIEVIAPALEVALTGPKRRYLDRPATYTVAVRNPGTASAREVELVTHLPAGLEFVSANNAGEYDPATQAVYWLLEELPPNETGTVTLTARPTEAGEHLIRLEGRAQQGLAAQAEQSIVVEGVAAILFQLADVTDPIEVNSETMYEIRVVNQGSKSATNVQLVADLPPGLKPVLGEGPTRHEIVGQQVVFEPIPRLAPKADTTYRIQVQGIEAGDHRVRVQILTDELKTPVTKEESTHVYADE